MTGLRARRLEQLGMVWSLTGERFQENLEAAKACYDQHWPLCAPRSASALDKPIGQWLSNLRRPGALDGKLEWEAALTAIDADWNPAWPAPWQRHYAVVREMLAEETILAYIEPGVTVHGMDIDRWLARQTKPEVWTALTEGQREPLEAVGVVPHTAELEVLAKPSTAASGAFERGVAGRGGGEARGVSRQQQEPPDKRTGDKLTALADLGLEWAPTEGAA
ncbi:hypothetical protein [Streptomyces sp. NPDC056983]|uniref:hypothetical protein n=1 Tax=Streptomyces sp. NPDC056983 TaxID=3345987 RepID=UPI0036264917